MRHIFQTSMKPPTTNLKCGRRVTVSWTMKNMKVQQLCEACLFSIAALERMNSVKSMYSNEKKKKKRIFMKGAACPLLRDIQASFIKFIHWKLYARYAKVKFQQHYTSVMASLRGRMWVPGLPAEKTTLRKTIIKIIHTFQNVISHKKGHDSIS